MCVILNHKNLQSIKNLRRYLCSLLTFTEISHKYKLPSKVCVGWLQQWCFFQESCYPCHLTLPPFTFSCNTVASIFQHWIVRNKDNLKQYVLPSPRVAQKELGGYSQSVMVPLSHFLLRLFLYSSVHYLQELHSLRAEPISTLTLDVPECSFLQGISICSSAVSSRGRCVDTCSTAVFAMDRGIWSTSSLSSLSGCFSSLLCKSFLPFLEYILLGTPQTPLTSPAVSCRESILEPDGTVSVQHRTDPVFCSQKPPLPLPPLPKSCHLLPIQEVIW